MDRANHSTKFQGARQRNSENIVENAKRKWYSCGSRVNIVRLSGFPTCSVAGWDVALERTTIGWRYNIASAATLKESRVPLFFSVEIRYGKRGIFMKKISTRNLVLMALLAAVSIVLTRFLVVYLTNTIRVSFGGIPIILASLLLGPVAGGITGAVADVLGASLFSPFGYYPPLTIPPVIVGILPALLKPWLLKEVRYWRILVIVLITDLIAHVGLTTYLLAGMYGTGFLELLVVRLPVSLAIAVVESILVYGLYKRLPSRL
jgi:ECF transporter S component (folate family)